MLHVPYTGMVLSFVVLGAVLAPSLSYLVLAGTLLAYFLGLGLGAHLLDQVPGMGSSYVRHWPARALWFGGLFSLFAAVALGIAGALWWVGVGLLAFVGVQAVCALGYPLASWFGGALHRDSVFALSWGSLPFLTSYYAQAGTLSVESALVAIVLASVAAIEIRLSRASRRLRLTFRSPQQAGPGEPGSPGSPFHRFDRALQALVLATILFVAGLLATRVAMEIW